MGRIAPCDLACSSQFNGEMQVIEPSRGLELLFSAIEEAPFDRVSFERARQVLNLPSGQADLVLLAMSGRGWLLTRGGYLTLNDFAPAVKALVLESGSVVPPGTGVRRGRDCDC